MTVTGTNNSISHIADGIQTVFPYDFLIADNDDLDVFLAGVQQTSGFTVTGAGNPVGGNVTFDVAPLVSETPVALIRSTSKTQLVDYTPFDPFPAETHEDALDKLTLIAQDEAALASNAVRAPADETLAQMILPPAASRINELLLFDTLGDVTTVPADSLTLATLQAFTDYLVDTFVGNGVETQFTLSANPVVIGNTQVYFDGVYQVKANYSLLDETLTFTTAPPDLVVVEVMHGQASSIVNVVQGPVSSGDEAIARFNGTSGLTLQNSDVYITDAGDMGVGEPVPDGHVHIKGTDGGAVGSYQGGALDLIIENAAGAGAGITIVAGNTASARLMMARNNNAQIGGFEYVNSTDTMRVLTAGNIRWSIDNTGAMSNPFQPCFNASLLINSTDVTGNGTLHILVFDTERFDQNNDYNGVNTFTAPKDGKYQFNINITTGGYITGATLLLALQTSNRNYPQQSNDVTPFGSGEQHNTIMSVLVDMDAGDTAFCELTVSGEASDLIDVFAGSAVNFSAALIT